MKHIYFITHQVSLPDMTCPLYHISSLLLLYMPSACKPRDILSSWKSNFFLSYWFSSAVCRRRVTDWAQEWAIFPCFMETAEGFSRPISGVRGFSSLLTHRWRLIPSSKCSTRIQLVGIFLPLTLYPSLLPQTHWGGRARQRRNLMSSVLPFPPSAHGL